MKRMIGLPVLIFILLCSGPALTHRVQVFAFMENGFIKGEATLSGGKKVINGTIKVVSKDDQKLLLTTTTGDSGLFTIDPHALGLEKPVDLLIVLDAGPGHRGEWQVSGLDYALTDHQSVPPPAATAAPAPLPTSPPLKNVVSGIISILGLGALIAWSRSRKRGKK
ncbi:MAG: hypothetical protein P8X86_15745 [Desulfofustis sp.]|jgi:nickel transport protein